MAGVDGVAVMIRRWFNDEVVSMVTAGTGQGRSAGSRGRRARGAAAITQSQAPGLWLGGGSCRYVSSAAARLICLDDLQTRPPPPPRHRRDNRWPRFVPDFFFEDEITAWRGALRRTGDGSLIKERLNNEWACKYSSRTGIGAEQGEYFVGSSVTLCSPYML